MVSQLNVIPIDTLLPALLSLQKSTESGTKAADDGLFTAVGAVGFCSLRLIFQHPMLYTYSEEEKALLYCQIITGISEPFL